MADLDLSSSDVLGPMQVSADMPLLFVFMEHHDDVPEGSATRARCMRTIMVSGDDFSSP